VSQQFHRIIEMVVLHPGKQRDPNRYISVLLKPDADGMIMSYVFAPRAMVGVHLLWPDGRTGFVDDTVLKEIPSVRDIPEEFDHLSHSELLERFVHPKLNYQIVYSGRGHYRAIPAT
jgi:hypothetical protein